MSDALSALMGRGTLSVRDAKTGALQAVGVVETLTIPTVCADRNCGKENRSCGDKRRAHESSNPTTA